MFLAQLQNLNQLRQTPDTRFPVYQAAGNWLAENTPSNRSVGALEVGIIGFYSQRPMIDFAGLIQPNVAEVFDHDATYEDAAFWAVQKYQPNYLVMFSGAFPALVKDYVTESCVLYTKFSGKDFAYPADLFIFDCSE